MTREIKFRAWDRNERLRYRMINNLSLNSAYFCQETMKGIEVMQYTGLKDKNGKEIYEGDIILVESEEKEVITDAGEGPIEEYSQLVPIVFQDGSFGVNLNSDYIFTNRFYTLKEIEDNSGQTEFEIIGNIYENPELLSTNK